ncbi:MAG: hypothetical protein ACREGL_01980 [Alphaproteobacteria bacterium]
MFSTTDSAINWIFGLFFAPGDFVVSSLIDLRHSSSALGSLADAALGLQVALGSGFTGAISALAWLVALRLVWFVLASSARPAYGAAHVVAPPHAPGRRG